MDETKWVPVKLDAAEVLKYYQDQARIQKRPTVHKKAKRLKKLQFVFRPPIVAKEQKNNTEILSSRDQKGKLISFTKSKHV